MGGAIERAKAHLAAASATPGRLEVPEWGAPGKPQVVTWTPVTVAERRKIYAEDAGKAPDGGLVMVRTVIRKACGPDGKKLFDPMEEHALLHEVDGAVVLRVGSAILYSDGLTGQKVEEAIDEAGEG